MLLFSGDGDFADLARRIRAKGKRVVVVSGKTSLSGALVRAVDRHVHLEQIGRLVKDLFEVRAEGQKTPYPAVRRGRENGTASIAGLLHLSSVSVDNGVMWVAVRSIEPVADEQVYDIEVAGTHNFIGNDIIAHNTYISNDLSIGGNDIALGTGTATTTISGGFGIGVGTTTPGAAFAIATSTAGLNTAFLLSNLGSGYTMWAEDSANDTTPFVIDSAGNVGIGTTGPTTKLQIVDSSSSDITPLRIMNSNSGANAESVTLGFSPDSGEVNSNAGAITVGKEAADDWSTGAGRDSFMAFYTDLNNAVAEKMRITSGGNVGIGTIAPIQALHVVGQCVTGDTRLRRRKRRKGINGEWIEEFDEVPIKDIQAGDEIASLDEATGMIVWSQVNALMDMGVKPIYKITTATGKSIRTTAEHPYFIKASDPELPKKKPRLGIFFDNANMFYAQRDAGWRVDVITLKRALEAQFEVAFFNEYRAVPVEGDPARQPTLDFMQSVGGEITFRTKPLKYIQTAEGIKKKGDMDVEIALDVTERIDELDVVLVMSGDSDLLPLKRYAAKRGKKIVFVGFRRNMAWELTKFAKYMYVDEYRSSLERGQKINSKPELGVALVRLLYSRPPSLSSGGVWKKVAQMSGGEIIAVKGTGDKAIWDHITSIEHT
ncbi:MAG: hypothetical protein A3J10_03605, partial [Candidatus Sungbacteria bacterium RIFCSPLOWO2_02_FULL_54_10]